MVKRPFATCLAFAGVRIADMRKLSIDCQLRTEMGTSPTQRTLAALRKEGKECGIVERWLAHAGLHGKRVDLFGFIDIIAMDEDGLVAIQSCGQAFSDHVRKICCTLPDDPDSERRLPLVKLWLRSAPLELWGWRKVKLKRGGKAERWSPRVADFWLEGDEVKWAERSK
jgi:hypothetical protein